METVEANTSYAFFVKHLLNKTYEKGGELLER